MATFNTRIQNRIDTWANWIAVDPTPLNGEICIATIPAETGAIKQEPAVIIKIGDGSKAFSELPILTAKAGNVSAWALADSKPTYAAGEITGIDAYISAYVNEQMGISVDTDTQYQIVKVDDYNYKLQSKGKTDSAWADVEGSSFVIPQYDDTALAGRVTAVEGDIAVLKGQDEGSVAKMISDAIAALDLANTYDAKGAAADAQAAAEATAAGALSAAKTELEGKITAEATTARAAEEANAAAAKAAQDDVDALEALVGTLPEGDAKTVVEYVDAKTAGIASDEALTALAGRVTTAEGAIDAIEADYLKAADKTELEGKITAEASRAAGIEAGLESRLAAVEGDYLKAADKAELQGNIDTVSSAVELLTNGVDAEKVDGVNDLIQYVEEHGTEVTGMKKDISDNAAAISAEAERAAGEEAKNAAAASAAQTAADNAQAAVEAEVTRATGVEGGLDTRLKAVEAKFGEGEGNVESQISTAKQEAIDAAAADATSKANTAEGNAKTYADGLNTAMDARVAELEAIEHHDHENKTVLDGITAEKVAAWDGAQAAAEATAAAALSAAKSELEGKITAEAEAARAAEKANADAIDAIEADYLKAADKTELSGAIAAETQRATAAEAQALTDAKAYTDVLEGKLAPVAKSGNVADLTQTAGEYVVFNCGGAAGWTAAE